jgi:phosphoenolpyruvate carboxylase
MRKIPATMVSQHPDHANAPYWHTDAFIRNQEEIFEAHSSFFDLGVSEYKWDWEGKFVDEAVVERLLSEYYEDFRTAPLGKDKFLTFRLPNPKVETEFRLGRAFMGIIGAAGLAEAAGLHSPPLFEVILPMTESSREMIEIQEAFREISSLKHPLLKMAGASTPRSLEIIPLFEQVDVIADSARIVREYIDYYERTFGAKPEYLRPYVARSDPALNAGLVPTVIAIKIALSRYKKLEAETGVALFPIIGSASLPFRGGLTPPAVERFVAEYGGIRTALLQSAFRYDYPIEEVRTAIAHLEDALPRGIAMDIPDGEETALFAISRIFEGAYRETIADLAPVINAVASVLPKRRERVQHTGLFGYSRGVGEVKLPRAIGFTAALYSVGAPPELIGTGRALRNLDDAQKALLRKYYVNIDYDLARMGRYVNKANIDALTLESPGWKRIMEDVAGVQAFLGTELKPVTGKEQAHAELTGRIYRELVHHSVSPKLVEEAAVLRRSLG